LTDPSAQNSDIVREAHTPISPNSPQNSNDWPTTFSVTSHSFAAFAWATESNVSLKCGTASAMQTYRIRGMRRDRFARVFTIDEVDSGFIWYDVAQWMIPDVEMNQPERAGSNAAATVLNRGKVDNGCN
jgi:hypothetical protein